MSYNPINHGRQKCRATIEALTEKARQLAILMG
jgi:hypothetical protein